MPPKFKFTKEEIANAALDITRKNGLSGLTARSLAAELNCSVKPIFGLFENMEEVQQAVYASAQRLYQSYLQKDMTEGSYPPYKASGMAYIRFAKEERELFRLLFMRDRSNERIEENKEEIRPLLNLIQQNLGIAEEEAYLFHLEMWLYVHGIATMLATSYLDWQEEFISRVLTDAYIGLKHRYLKHDDLTVKEAANGCNLSTGIDEKYRELTAVDNLNLTIRQGELFSLLGVNGAGKTTTIKMLSCLTKPDEGDALLNDASILSDTAKVKSLIGVSPQETAVAPNLTVRENLELMCGVHGFSKEKRRQKVTALAAQFALTEILGKRAGKLSGGWQRRLSLAMALISEPQILFLDEPTLGLDVLARSELWDTIRTLKGKITIVLTTHYMEEAEALSDRIGIMKGGRLLTVGTAGELKAMTGTDRFEDAFIAIVKGDVK